MYIMFTDGFILLVIYEEELGQIVAEIKAAGLDITEERYVEDFLWVNIGKLDSETYHMSQPQLINQIVSNMGLSKSDANPRTTPAFTTKILVNFQDAEIFDQKCRYCSVIGKLNY